MSERDQSGKREEIHDLNGCQIFRKGDQVYVQKPDEEAVPVRVAWARPLTGRGKEISVLHAQKKREVLFVENLEETPQAVKIILEQELSSRYLLPKITRVIETKVQFGNRYWSVETTHGSKYFVMKSPQTHVEWVTPDSCILRDSMGNHYEIASLAALDEASKSEIDRVM